MNTVLILDTETTGLDPKRDRCIEVAIVRYSIRHAAVIDAGSWLLRTHGSGTPTNEAEHINQIPPAILAHGGDPDRIWRSVVDATATVDAILAHNAPFDRKWTPGWFPPDPPWIDTCNGVTWPRETRPGMALDRLCQAHNVCVMGAHRALGDCLMLAHLLTQCADLGHDVARLLARALRPTATFQALVSYDARRLAKDKGFKWDNARKVWLRTMAVEDTAGLGFPVREVRDA